MTDKSSRTGSGQRQSCDPLRMLARPASHPRDVTRLAEPGSLLGRFRVVVDAHVHLYPPEAGLEPAAWAARHGEGHWAALTTRLRKNGRPVQGFATVDQLLRDMDAGGVAKAVLLGWYWEHHATCVAQNRFYAECVRAHPDRLAAFATLQPAAGSVALDEAARALADGLIGFGEMSPHSQHFALTNSVWLQLLQLASERQVPVNLHVTDPASRPYPGRVETPLDDFLNLARDFPATTFILAHWGGSLAWSADATARPNVWFDTAASPLLYGPEVWQKVTSERVLFGSDYPLILYPRTESVPAFGGVLAEAQQAGASSETLGENAVRLLRLSR